MRGLESSWACTSRWENQRKGWQNKVSNTRALPNSFTNISLTTHNPLCFYIATHLPLLVWQRARWSAGCKQSLFLLLIFIFPSEDLIFHLHPKLLSSLWSATAVLLGPGLRNPIGSTVKGLRGSCVRHSLTKKAWCQFDVHPQVSQNVNELLWIRGKPTQTPLQL